MTAKEANKKTKENINSSMHFIYDKINKAIDKHEFSVEIHKNFCNKTQIEYLRTDGYSVYEDKYLDYITINWEKVDH